MLLSFSTYADFTALDHQGNEVQYVALAKDADLRGVKNMFILSFINNFSDIPIGDLAAQISLLEPKYKTIGHAVRSLESDFNEEVRLLRQEKTTCVSANQLGQIVGFACFQKDLLHPTVVFVRSLVVDPDFQRKGIGKDLLFSIRNDPSLLPTTDRIFLITSAGYRKSIQFYKKNGFKENFDLCKTCDPSRHVVLDWHSGNLLAFLF